MSYLDLPLQLQQASSVFIFFSKQQGKSDPELGTGVHPIPVVPLMSQGVGLFSEKVPQFVIWMTVKQGCTVAGVGLNDPCVSLPTQDIL